MVQNKQLPGDGMWYITEKHYLILVVMLLHLLFNINQIEQKNRTADIVTFWLDKNSIFLRKNLDGKEVRYDERVFGRDENDQGSGVASEGFF